MRCRVCVDVADFPTGFAGDDWDAMVKSDMTWSPSLAYVPGLMVCSRAPILHGKLTAGCLKFAYFF